MEHKEALIKLKALHIRLQDQLSNGRARFFPPNLALEYFNMFIPIRDSLRQGLPNYFADFPVRNLPKSSGTSDFDGAGYITRGQLEVLFQDMSHMLDIINAISDSPESQSSPNQQNSCQLLQPTSPSISVSSPELPPPDKITAHWLWEHVPFRFWLTYLALLGGAFILGIQASRLHWVREIFGL